MSINLFKKEVPMTEVTNKIVVPKTVFTAAKKALEQAEKKASEANLIVEQRRATLNQMTTAE